MSEPRLIKKYPNRRLYDTELSRYITIDDVRALINSHAVRASSNNEAAPTSRAACCCRSWPNSSFATSTPERKFPDRIDPQLRIDASRGRRGRAGELHHSAA
jgi:hypothetical protein